MGWSLGGILAGAGKGMADWAGREIVAEKQAERDAAQFDRQKELAAFQDELAAGRAERTAELTKRYADKTAAEKKESQANAFEALEWAATKDPDGPKLKPGTADYYRFLGDKLDASGEPDMAKQMYSNADKFEDNALRNKQVNAQLAGVAESRAARADARSAAEDEKQFNRDAKQIDRLGAYTIKIPDPDNPGKTLVTEDKSGQAALYNLYQASNGNMALVTQAGAGAQALMRSNPGKYPTLGSAVDAFAQQQIEASKPKPPAPAAATATARPVRKGILGDGALVDQIPQ